MPRPPARTRRGGVGGGIARALALHAVTSNNTGHGSSGDPPPRRDRRRSGMTVHRPAHDHVTPVVTARQTLSQRSPPAARTQAPPPATTSATGSVSAMASALSLNEPANRVSALTGATLTAGLQHDDPLPPSRDNPAWLIPPQNDRLCAATAIGNPRPIPAPNGGSRASGTPRAHHGAWWPGRGAGRLGVPVGGKPAGGTC